MSIKHAVLRILLWHHHLAPLHDVPFLEDAAHHGLLYKVGGEYMFAHPSFGEYFRLFYLLSQHLYPREFAAPSVCSSPTAWRSAARKASVLGNTSG